MKVWHIWVQGDGATWLHSAWDDETTAENREGYEAALEAAEKDAVANNGLMRVLAVEIPDEAIYGLFRPPVAQGTPLPEVEES